MGGNRSCYNILKNYFKTKEKNNRLICAGIKGQDQNNV
jgi:hypothetical protein